MLRIAPALAWSLSKTKEFLKFSLFGLALIGISIVAFNMFASLGLPKRLSAIPISLLAVLSVSVGALAFVAGRKWLIAGGLSILGTFLFHFTFFVAFDGPEMQAVRKVNLQAKRLSRLANTPGMCYSRGKDCAFLDIPEWISPMWRIDSYSEYSEKELRSTLRDGKCLLYSLGPDRTSQDGVAISIPPTEIGIDSLNAMVPARFWKKTCKLLLPEACVVAPGDLVVQLPDCQ